MSVPKLTAKLRIKNKIPFAIETLSGVQFRCGVCGKIFLQRKELDAHINNEKEVVTKKLQFPELYQNIYVKVIYTQDIRDVTNPDYPRLMKGDKLFKISTKDNEK